MSRTNLAYIMTAADAALVREVETPMLSMKSQDEAIKAGLTVIAGFSIDDKALVREKSKALLAQRRLSLSTYCTDRDEIIKQLRKLDVTPLAILPKTAWERICSESGLIRLNPNNDGSVWASKQILKTLTGQAGNIFFGLTAATGVISSFLLGVLCYILGTPLWGCAIMWLVVGFIFLWLIGGIDFGGTSTAEKSAPGWLERIFVRRSIKAFGEKPWDQVIKEFFPKGHSEEDLEPVSDRLYVWIILPQPPTDVAATLLKARGLFPLKVATVPEAIAFTESPNTILRREFDRTVKVKQEIARVKRELFWEALRNDPIVYFEKGTAVAIIAQFGDFPIEQQVVDRVISSEHLV